MSCLTCSRSQANQSGMWGNSVSPSRAFSFYSRIRKLDMDAMRAKRQRKVLTSLINAYKSKPLGEMLALTSEILQTGCIQTDMTPNEVLSYVAKLFPMLSTATLNSQQMPAEGTYQSMTVGSVTSAKVCDFEANRKILQNFLQ